jgi:uncharacterized protein (TIGR00297 family)
LGIWRFVITPAASLSLIYRDDAVVEAQVTQWIGGLLLALLISYGALRANSLTREGAVASAALGTLVFGAGGWQWAILMIIFFVSSSVLSHLFKNRRGQLAEKYAKGGRRDAAQVLGNGGIAAIFVVIQTLFPGAAWPWLGYAAALAAANADTWATELSLLSRSRPRLITHLQFPVEAGTSGAISGSGTLAALAGAASIGVLASALAPSRVTPVFWPCLLGGALGAVFDSFLGATVQTMYLCARENRETEQHPVHICGSPTVYLRGWRWLSNDWVNACSCAVGAITACLAAIASSAI